ncbi:SIS domain-containing protein, partial [Pseudomonas aeruginosa]|nr:SIS domain-containing protein [Pseudomonas aeruginosa]
CIYVIGLRRSFSVASYLTYALRHLDRKAFLIDGLGGMFTEQLSLVGPKDVVVAVSFSPYARETCRAAGRETNDAVLLAAMEEVGLDNPRALLKRYPFEMSGG